MQRRAIISASRTAFWGVCRGLDANAHRRCAVADYTPVDTTHYSFKDLTGLEFGRLTVVKLLGKKITRSGSSRNAYWLCRCLCSRNVEVRGSHLTGGKIVSCGCYQNDIRGQSSLTHGMSRTKVHTAWEAMKGRCFNPKNGKFALYGARGITVYPGWIDDFLAFYSFIGDPPSPLHSLDRIDGDGNYEPGNVRWATPSEQSNNLSTNRILELNGRKQTLAQWSKEVGIEESALRARLKRGWTLARALAGPLRHEK